MKLIELTILKTTNSYYEPSIRIYASPEEFGELHKKLIDSGCIVSTIMHEFKDPILMACIHLTTAEEIEQSLLFIMKKADVEASKEF